MAAKASAAAKTGKSKAPKSAKAKPAAPVRITSAQKLDKAGEDVIFGRIANCEFIHKIAGSYGISAASLHAWLDARPEMYARARERQADKMADDILAIADELVIEAKYAGEDVTLDVSSAAVARNRLRVDARKWLAAKMSAKKYGDKQTIDINAEVTMMTDDQRRARLAELQEKAGLLKK